MPKVAELAAETVRESCVDQNFNQRFEYPSDADGYEQACMQISADLNENIGSVQDE